MIRKTTLLCLTSALAVSLAADAADAKSKQRKRIAQPSAAQQAPAFHQQPARMIEVQPGVWVSSYGCITDEGYGRRLPCDITDSGGGR
jgi:hypothetical protein